jgi:hypothetical protein
MSSSSSKTNLTNSKAHKLKTNKKKKMAMLNLSDNGLKKEPKMRLLPESFTPSKHDFVCGRGRKIFMHVGNQRFRQLVERRLQEYSNAANKLEKSCIICEMVLYLRTSSPHGGFVKRNSKDGRWYLLGDFLSREKTSQAFRDALVDQHRSIDDSKKQLHVRKPHGTAVPDATFQASLRAQLIKHPSTTDGAKVEEALSLVTPKQGAGIVSYHPSSQYSSLYNSEWASQNVALLKANDEFKRIPSLYKTFEAQDPTSKLNQATEQAVIDERSTFERLVLIVDSLDKGDDPFEPNPFELVPCVVTSFAA